MSSHMGEESLTFLCVCEGAVCGSTATVRITATSAPPGDAGLVVAVVPWGRISLEQLAHARTQCECVEFGVASWIKGVGAAGTGGRASSSRVVARCRGRQSGHYRRCARRSCRPGIARPHGCCSVGCEGSCRRVHGYRQRER